MTALNPYETTVYYAALADDYLTTYALAVEVFEDGGFSTPDEYRARLAARLASDIRNAYISDCASAISDDATRRLYPVLLAGYDAISWERIAARLVDGFTLYGVTVALDGGDRRPLAAPTYYLSLDEAATEVARLVEGLTDEGATENDINAVAYALGEAVAANVVPVSVVAGGLVYRIATF